MIKNKKILVVGAGGFIGGHLVKRLLNDGNSIVAVDIKPKEYWFQDFDKVKLEIWDEHRGGDNSSIGCSGYFTEWRHVWPEENTPYKLTRTYLKSLEPKQLALDF